MLCDLLASQLAKNVPNLNLQFSERWLGKFFFIGEKVHRCRNVKDDLTFFSSTALTSTGLVQMTIKPLHCPHQTSSAAVIESQSAFFSVKKCPVLRIEPGPAGWEAGTLPLWYADPLIQASSFYKDLK